MASTRLGDAPRIENTESTSWKPLCSSSGHALDDDDDASWACGIADLAIDCKRPRPHSWKKLYEKHTLTAALRVKKTEKDKMGHIAKNCIFC